MATSNINTIEGRPRAVGNRVLVTDMDFGEQVSTLGIIIGADDGKARGVKPRWGKVYSIGPRLNEDYEVGDWILVEHGRWTRGIKINDGEGEKIIRMVEATSIIGYAKEKPNDVILGQEFSNGDSMNIRPEDFLGKNY